MTSLGATSDPGVALVEQTLAQSRRPFESIAGEISAYQSRNMPAPPESVQKAVGYLSGLANFFSPAGAMAAELQRLGIMSAPAAERLAAAAKECQDACSVYSQMIADDTTAQADRAKRISEAEHAAQQDLFAALANRQQAFEQGMQGLSGS